MVARLSPLLFRSTRSSTLALFRIFWGAVLFWEVTRYWPRLKDLYIAPPFHFTYDFFHWVTPWPGDGMYIHFFIMGMATLGVLFGFFYRFFSAVLFVSFSLFFLMEQAKYLNHFYLVCLIAFSMIFIRADASLSLDNLFRNKETVEREVPFWQVLLLRLQIAIVYFYGGIAKLNWDWLQCEPIRDWSLKSADHPLLGPIVTQPFSPYFYAYGGIIFDLGIPFLLMFRKTRKVAIPLVLFFHLSNAHMFTIGIFPWFMIAATVIFVDPEYMNGLIRSVYSKLPLTSLSTEKKRKLFPTSRFALIFFFSFMAFQTLYPFRHWFIPGDVAWTEEGHKFSWRMKLRDKSSLVRALAIDGETGERQLIHPRTHLTKRQARKMATRPDMMHQYAVYLEKKLLERGWKNPKIHLFSLVSLNGRPFRWMIDPRVDLSKAIYSPFHASSWIVPLEKGLPIGDYDIRRPSEVELRRLGEWALTNPNAPLPLPK